MKMRKKCLKHWRGDSRLKWGGDRVDVEPRARTEKRADTAASEKLSQTGGNIT